MRLHVLVRCVGGGVFLNVFLSGGSCFVSRSGCGSSMVS